MGKFDITHWIGPLAWLLRLSGLTLHRQHYQSFSHSWQSVRDLLDLANAAQVAHWQQQRHHNGQLRPSGDHCRFSEPTDTNWIAIPDWEDRRIRTRSNPSARSYDRLAKYMDSDLDRVVTVVQFVVLAEAYPWDQQEENRETPAPPARGIDWTTGREIR